MLVMSQSKEFLRGLSLALSALAVFLMAGCHRSVSGSYLAADNSAVVWLEIVRTPDGHLTGQMATNTLRADGSLTQSSAAIAGAADGENVTIQASRLLGLDSFALSGTLNGDVLTLTGVRSVPVTFRRSTTAEFQKKISELNARSKSIIQEKASAQNQLRELETLKGFVAEIDRLMSRMEQFEAEADRHLSKFPGAEDSYQRITAEMARDVARERQLAGDPNASVTRGQLSVAATQASIQTEQMHGHGQSLQSALETDVKPMGTESATLLERCDALSRITGTPVPEGLKNAREACGRLESAVPPFTQKFSAMSAGLDHLDSVYRRELGKQENLIKESERLE